ncbi:hypothetical protein HPP92_011713 [Vanilla planifolia]|uniref:Uncharacterized protein n=1 Tax=Vanilla planifolia TaxID=51239 RepID=A0A835R3E9_VANPL|nr:hypothetical protein HPP92_011713 [Vanilla planifolia]
MRSRSKDSEAQVEVTVEGSWRCPETVRVKGGGGVAQDHELSGAPCNNKQNIVSGVGFISSRTWM